MTKIEIIQEKCSLLKNKSQFIRELALFLNDKGIEISPLTIAHHWLNRFWQIPDNRQDDVIECLKAHLSNPKNLKPEKQGIKTGVK